MLLWLLREFPLCMHASSARQPEMSLFSKWNFRINQLETELLTMVLLRFSHVFPLRARTRNMWKFVKRAKQGESAAQGKCSWWSAVFRVFCFKGNHTDNHESFNLCSSSGKNEHGQVMEKTTQLHFHESWEKWKTKMPLYRWHLPLEIFF